MSDAPSVPPLRARVSVDWGTDRSFIGVVNDHRSVLGKRNSIVHEFHIVYDDGDAQWHDPNEWSFDVLDQPVDDGFAETEWSRIEARCCLSLQPLTDPALGDSCAHAARCNYDQLREYVGRMRNCPVVGCPARIPRTRDIVRDEQLRRILQQISTPEDTVWWCARTATLRTTAPPQPAKRGCVEQQRRSKPVVCAAIAPSPSVCEEVAIVVDEEDDDDMEMGAANQQTHRASGSCETEIAELEELVVQAGGARSLVAGWHCVKHIKKTSSGGAMYKVYSSSDGQKFRSLREVFRFLDLETGTKRNRAGAGTSASEHAACRLKRARQEGGFLDGADDSLREAQRRQKRIPMEVVTEVDGVELHLSSRNPNGYEGVFHNGSSFGAYYHHGHLCRRSELGTFDSAVAAALAYAKFALVVASEGLQAAERLLPERPTANPKAPCRHCGKLFTTLNLPRHETQKCPESVEAVLNSVLTQLERQEEDLHTFPCRHCGKTFYGAARLKLHETQTCPESVEAVLNSVVTKMVRQEPATNEDPPPPLAKRISIRAIRHPAAVPSASAPLVTAAKHLSNASVAAASPTPMQSSAEHSSTCNKRSRLVVRCGKCDECTRGDCGMCKNCFDKPKFGGTNQRRQGCVHKICRARCGGTAATANQLVGAQTWTHEEEEKLAFYVSQLGRDWVKISDAIPGRTAMACSVHWKKLYGGKKLNGVKTVMRATAVAAKLKSQPGEAQTEARSCLMDSLEAFRLAEKRLLEDLKLAEAALGDSTDLACHEDLPQGEPSAMPTMPGAAAAHVAPAERAPKPPPPPPPPPMPPTLSKPPQPPPPIPPPPEPMRPAAAAALCEVDSAGGPMPGLGLQAQQALLGTGIQVGYSGPEGQPPPEPALAPVPMAAPESELVQLATDVPLSRPSRTFTVVGRLRPSVALTEAPTADASEVVVFDVRVPEDAQPGDLLLATLNEIGTVDGSAKVRVVIPPQVKPGSFLTCQAPRNRHSRTFTAIGRPRQNMVCSESPKGTEPRAYTSDPGILVDVRLPDGAQPGDMLLVTCKGNESEVMQMKFNLLVPPEAKPGATITCRVHFKGIIKPSTGSANGVENGLMGSPGTLPTPPPLPPPLSTPFPTPLPTPALPVQHMV